MNQEELNKLERKRKVIYSAILTLNIVIVILFIGIIISLAVSFTSLDISSPNFEKFLIIPFITIALIAILIFVNEYIKNLINLISKEISKTIYEPAFKEKNTEFSYDDGLTLDEVMSSELLPPPDDFASSSLTKGEILGFPYKASNITLWEEREERDSKGRTYRTKVITFDGRMYIIETPFNKKGIILKSKKIEEGKLLDIAVSVIIILIAIGLVTHNLLPMLSDPYFKKEVVEFFKENLLFFIGFALIIILTIISSILSNREKEYQEAQLESSQFNEYFDIKTQDQVELRKTLTPAVMERLINLRNSIGEFHLSIIGNKIFFAFPKSFDIKYSKPIQQLMQEVKESVDKEIETIKSIIETLKLEEEKIKKGIISK
jgi:ABC-type multidrug transport system fused ATPase/permease subunit